MGIKKLRSFSSRRRRWLGKFGYVHIRLAALAGVLLVALAMAWPGIAERRLMAANSVDPAVYAPLLETIARGESRGNYNAYFGNSTNTSIRFTEMTVSQVRQWQEGYIAQGSPSSAVGKYQIISPTLESLIKQLRLDTDTMFDEHLQDRLGVALLEKRGAADYMGDRLSREQFAANLAQEWAALPKVLGENPHQSYYASDGLNKVQISVDEIFTALASIKS